LTPWFKAVASDVDGTLTDRNRRICVSALEAVRRLEANRVKVILVSGLPYPILRGLSTYLGTTGAIIAENGGVVHYKNSLSVLGSNKSVRRALKMLVKEFGDKVSQYWTNDFRLTDLAIQRTLPYGVLLKTLEGKKVNVKVADTGFAYHIFDSHVGRDRGLKIASQKMGLEPSEVLGIGDSDADSDLIRNVGFGVAVANATPMLKSLADYVTAKPYGDGFAETAGLLLKGVFKPQK